MAFKMKYEIQKKYLTSGSKRRSGIKASPIKFVVAHDTGNPNSTALGNVNYYENSRNDISASAHIFVDDKNIIECIPALTGTPEKAWHVLYNVQKDNQMFGADANDAAIGIEMCYGSNFNTKKDEVYKRFVWVTAYTCYKFGLDPRTKVTGHFILDPNRKIDPQNGLSTFGISWDQYLRDVVKEYNDCVSTPKPDITTPVTPNPIEKEEDTMTPAEKEAYVKLEKTVQDQATLIANMKTALDGIEKNQSIDVPAWAADAVYYFKRLEYAPGKFVLDTPNGRSLETYTLLVILHRALIAKGLI